MSRRAKTGRRINLDNLELFGGHIKMTTISSKRDISNHFKFTIVRNPFDRFVSLWLTRYRDRPMSEFVRDIKTRKLRWHAMWPQISWIADRDKKLMVDYLIRYESYMDGIYDVLSMLGIERFEIPHLRKTERYHDYRLYYTKDENIKFVKEFYKDDLRILGYTY